MPRLWAGNSLGVEAIWQHKAPSVWSRRIANLPLLTCRHGQIPAPDGSSSAQCFAQPSLRPMCRSGAPFAGDINEPCHEGWIWTPGPRDADTGARIQLEMREVLITLIVAAVM